MRNKNKSKYVKNCIICGQPYKTKGSHVLTCGEKCSKENKRRLQQIYNEKSRKKFIKSSSEAIEFFKKFDFNRIGMKQMSNYSISVITLLTCFKEYLELDEIEKLKIEVI